MSCHEPPAHNGVPSTSHSNITAPQWLPRPARLYGCCPAGRGLHLPAAAPFCPGLRGDPPGCPHTSQQPFLQPGVRGRPTPFHRAFCALRQTPPGYSPLHSSRQRSLAEAGQASAAALCLCVPATPAPPRDLGFSEDSSVSSKLAQGLVNTRPRGDRCCFFKDLTYHKLPDRPSAPAESLEAGTPCLPDILHLVLRQMGLAGGLGAPLCVLKSRPSSTSVNIQV